MTNITNILKTPVPREGLYCAWIRAHGSGHPPLICVWIDPSMTAFEANSRAETTDAEPAIQAES